MTPEGAKVKQVQDDAMSRMKAKWSMLNGNRLDETLREDYQKKILLYFVVCYNFCYFAWYKGTSYIRYSYGMCEKKVLIK